MKKVLEKIFGSHSEREIKKIEYLVNDIEDLRPQMMKLSDSELSAKTEEFKKRLTDGVLLDDILVEAFATVREAARRTTGEEHFRVQLIGGIVLHQGRISEMKTGEGKTLTAALPLYLNALTGRGVHLVTVNDYLAKLHGELMAPIYNFLGMSIGTILTDMSHDERKAAYAADITYGTNNEYGFDYLRDNMAIYEHDKVQRHLHYAVIDEVDSVLIDEARTPLIISGQSAKSTQLYKVADFFVRGLVKGSIVKPQDNISMLMRTIVEEDGDFVVDEKTSHATLTAQGIEKSEKFFKVENLADPENVEIQHHINIALRAHNLMHIEEDYIVKDGQIIIVDEFTGRLMSGRRYSDGLHQAIEAKEGVEVMRESKTLATITFQSYFNKYDKKSGMTGTALTEEEEFREIYSLDVIVIPTNMPLARIDLADQVYKNKKGKIEAIINEIEVAYKKGQPVLVGTITIDSSEEISSLLKKRGVPHQVLNAKYHEKEAEIVALAGQKNAVTIATNMAGRGTDIKLGEDVPAVGGLKIIGTERHEARRIDNQLRGRSGRQGDIGESRFYISLEDEIMRLFGSDKMLTILNTLKMPDDMAIEHGMLTSTIEKAQKKVESRNFAIRKRLMDYDRVMNDQRELIYTERNKVLNNENLKGDILRIINRIIEQAINIYTTTNKNVEEWDLAGLREYIGSIIPIGKIDFTEDEKQNLDKDLLETKIKEVALKLYETKEKELTEEHMREAERIILLRVVDQKWMDHIDNMEQMKQGIGLQGYAQRDPVMEYQRLGFEMFEDMQEEIQKDTVRGLYNVQMQKPLEREQVAKDAVASHGDSGEEVKKKPKVNRAEDNIGRNDMCPCGSGKKYKYCCGK
ncbi:MAG TPA: preprotein translocase subunit SecA [Clostridiales bacterium]|nr:MAG: preprotein translocase subunit SecA [Clostridiales bacterium GWD2_32_59]HAN10538.1 preprotein translocase subunit SecA [Clostridiales bacterium]